MYQSIEGGGWHEMVKSKGFIVILKLHYLQFELTRTLVECFWDVIVLRFVFKCLGRKYK